MTKFHELPDSIECGKMKEYFEEYLSYYCNNTNSENVHYALNELLELADRQWHTYEPLEECVKENVERYLKAVIDLLDESVMHEWSYDGEEDEFKNIVNVIAKKLI